MTDHCKLRIDEIVDRLPIAASRHADVAYWMNVLRRDHPQGSRYDGNGGSAGGVPDLSSSLYPGEPDDERRSYAAVVRPDRASLDAKRYREAWDTVVAKIREIENIQSRYQTTQSIPPLVADDPNCSHCGSEPRYRGDTGRRCYDWKRSHAGELPPDYVLEAWRRGKQPKVRVG